jgi:hypothetical protein
MIFDDQISDPKAKADYHAIRERMPVRNPQHLQQCVMVCVGMLLKVETALVGKYLPELMGQFAGRYITGIQQRYMSLAKAGSVIQTPWS